MPNAHHKSKRKLTIWTEEDLKVRAQKILQKKGLTLTDEITNLLIKIIKDDERNENQRANANNKSTGKGNKKVAE